MHDRRVQRCCQLRVVRVVHGQLVQLRRGSGRVGAADKSVAGHLRTETQRGAESMDESTAQKNTAAAHKQWLGVA